MRSSTKITALAAGIAVVTGGAVAGLTTRGSGAHAAAAARKADSISAAPAPAAEQAGSQGEEGGGQAGAPSSTTTSTSAGANGATVRVTIACQNSHDPRCGPFRWNPAPGPDQPMNIEVSASPAAPRVGQHVTFTVTSSDPDAPGPGRGTFLAFGDGPPMG